MIHITLLGIPLSSNHAYFNHPRGGRALTKEGKKYKVETTTYIARAYPAALATIRKNEPYCVYFRLYIPDVENSGWPKKAENRYKTLDVSNRVKLLEDALKDACGIDDSQHFIVIVEKRPGQPKTEIFMWNLQEEVPPIGELVRL